MSTKTENNNNSNSSKSFVSFEKYEQIKEENIGLSNKLHTLESYSNLTKTFKKVFDNYYMNNFFAGVNSKDSRNRHSQIFHPFAHSLFLQKNDLILSEYWKITLQDNNKIIAVNQKNGIKVFFSFVSDSGAGRSNLFDQNYSFDKMNNLGSQKLMVDTITKDCQDYIDYCHRNNAKVNVRHHHHVHSTSNRFEILKEFFIKDVIEQYGSCKTKDGNEVQSWYLNYADHKFFYENFIKNDTYGFHIIDGYYEPLMAIKKEFIKERMKLKNKISANNKIILAYKENKSLEEITIERKQSFEEKKIMVKSKKLGKHIENFTKLSMELMKLEESIKFLKEKMASEDDDVASDLNYANMQYKLDRITRVKRDIDQISNRKQ